MKKKNKKEVDLAFCALLVCSYIRLHLSAGMTTIQKVRLLVKDSDDVTVMDESVTGIASGKDIFDTMNRRCGFDNWASAFASWQGRACSLYTGVEADFTVKADMQKFIDRLSPCTEQCTFTLEVQKQGDRRSDGPRGPDSATHPGLRPWNGPGPVGFDTPGGPRNLARMREMLGVCEN